jgi:hypothetical protein
VTAQLSKIEGKRAMIDARDSSDARKGFEEKKRLSKTGERTCEKGRNYTIIHETES